MTDRPGAGSDRTRVLGELLHRFDEAGNRYAERWRGRPWADTAAAVMSNLADYGLVWVLAAAAQGRRRRRSRRRAVVALGVAGVASYTVNRTLKQALGRGRPLTDTSALLALPVRRPTSSSFPSGHTLASFCTASVIAEGMAGTGVAFAFASAVALSRVHLGAHHPSDVAGGAVIGAFLGVALRPVVRRAS